ncbi:MAG TPA: TlpA disulfide reductase family protein [Polyangia bacterium]|jgi:thiol-disulfide isomerase/thioredoxin|nr:TlpA disulfide reductase family protein [Polyangia bacterium]
MRCTTLSSIFAFTLALTVAVASSARAEVKAGQTAADFSGSTLAGSPLKLSSLRGKVVLVDFWASWCEPCKKELPLLDKLAPRLRAKGIEIVAVNIDDDKNKAADFVKSHGLHLTVLPDSTKKIVSAYEPPKMPSSFVVDKAGVVRAVHGGFEPGDESKLEAELTQLVSK